MLYDQFIPEFQIQYKKMFILFMDKLYKYSLKDIKITLF